MAVDGVHAGCAGIYFHRDPVRPQLLLPAGAELVEGVA